MLSNNPFTGRARITVNYGRHDGRAPVQWIIGVPATEFVSRASLTSQFWCSVGTGFWNRLVRAMNLQ